MSLLDLDTRLTNSLYYLTQHNSAAQHAAYLVATYLIYALPILLIILFWQSETRVQSAKIFVMTMVTWFGINKPLGYWLYHSYGFRDRPFAAHGLTELLFEQPQKAFPSDHTAVLMFVMLALFYYGHKRWGWTFAALLLLSSFARVAVGFHWAGDIVGGLAVGAIGFGLLVIFDRPLQKVGEWFFGLFKGSQTNVIPSS